MSKKIMLLAMLAATLLMAACAPAPTIEGFTTDFEFCTAVIVSYTADADYGASTTLSAYDTDGNLLGSVVVNNTPDDAVLNATITFNSPVPFGKSVYITNPASVADSASVMCGQGSVDSDLDGILNGVDNCPTVYNPDQAPGATSDRRGAVCEGNVYDVGLGVVGFVTDTGRFVLYSGCVGYDCYAIADFDPASFTPESMPKQLQLSGVYYEVTAHYLGKYDTDGISDVYQVNVVGPTGLMDDHLLIIVFPNGTWQFQERPS